MYKVLGNDNECSFNSLDEAMQYAKELGIFVTIKSNEYEIVGKFGVDTIMDGKCPDGVDYSWYKRRLA